MKGDAVIDGGNLHRSVLQPVEEVTDRVVVLGDVAVQRHRRRGDDLSHAALLHSWEWLLCSDGRGPAKSSERLAKVDADVEHAGDVCGAAREGVPVGAVVARRRD